jgi:glycosyltransferase involved in cell wall biosynthesis
VTAAPQPIRVLKLLPTLLCGGTENQFLALSRGLDSERFDVELACLRRLGPFVAAAEHLGRPLREYPIAAFRSRHAVVQQLRLARHIVRRRIEIVHAYNFYGNVFALPPARLAATPVVLASIRDCGPYLTPMQVRVQRQICRLATRVLVNAEAVRAWLINQGYDPARIVMIPNGVELDRFDVAADPCALRQELGLPRSAPLVTVVSRLHHLKGLEPFLEASAEVAKQFPEVYFLVVGDAGADDQGYASKLAALAARLGIGGRVIFTGFRGDVPALLAMTSVAVMPSLNEALSNSLLEAMAAGAATVATRVGGTPEAVTDGVTGLLVPPGDPAAMAAAIGRLLRDPAFAAQLGTAARLRVRERYSVARMVETTERLYETLLAETRPRRVSVPRPAPAPASASTHGQFR